MPSYQADDAPAAPSRLGRYELLGRLATGGMAEIYLARLAGEAGFEKIVVVKRLHPALAAADDYVRMFLDEGKLVSRLDHPNICEVHELGRDGADYFLAMPFLDGVPVTELIARPRDPDRRSQLRVAAGVVAQACAGLHHAHDHRGADGEPLHLVHRDASPSNLFVTASGVVKVLDFGIAKVRGATATEIGIVKGKWQYMAPEQVAGEELDRRCDVFALGIVLFELATHQRLFKRDSEFLAARAVLEEPIPRADAIDPAVPTALADVIAKALSRAKTERHADCRELATEIQAAIEIATPAEIARSLASDHVEELTKQRTRQQRVIELARDSAVTRRVDEVTHRRALDRDADSARTTPIGSRVARARRTAAIVAAAFAIVTLVTVVVVIVATNRERASTEPGGSATVARESDGSAASAHAPDGSAVTPPDRSAVTTDAAAPADAANEIEMPVDHLPSPQTAPKPGSLSIESTPYATIVVDSHSLGPTPIVHRQLPAGKHHVRATLADGRHKDFVIDVPAGKSAAPITLTW